MDRHAPRPAAHAGRRGARAGPAADRRAAPFEASVTRVDGGYTVQVTARSLVRDLTLLVDKLDPDAQVDAQVVTVPAGERAIFRVRSAVQLDEAALVGPRVLRSVNALVAGGSVAGRDRP